MRLKQRLEAAERKESGGKGPLIIYLRTIYEGKHGGVEEEYRRAVIVGGLGQSGPLAQESDESAEVFRERVERECLRIHGRLPRSRKSRAEQRD